MGKAGAVDKDLIDRFVEALEAVPEADASIVAYEERYDDARLDAEVELTVSGKSHTLFIELRKSVYPRDAQQILWSLQRLAGHANQERRKSVIPVIVAESISPGAKDLLKSEACGFFDKGGSLFIPARGAYIYIDKPPPKSHEKTVGGLFRGKRSQVLHALLLHRDEWFGVHELAKLAEVSPATTSETLSALEQFEWLDARGKGPSKERKLGSPGAVLDEWRKRVLASTRRQKAKLFYIPRSKPNEIMDRLSVFCEERGLKHVFTGDTAAQVYAPFLTDVARTTCRLAFGYEVDALSAKLDAREVQEGANLQVIETRESGEFLFKERIQGHWLASPVQVYLDLLQSAGRSKDMAENLRHEKIGF